MIKAIFTFDYYADNIQKFEALGYDITFIDEKEATYTDSLKDTEVLICYNPFSTLDISKFHNLKWIQLASIGVDQVPKDIAIKNNLIITNNKGGYKIPIGEWIVMDILSLIKKSMSFYKNKEQKLWELNENIFELYGKTIGFIGTGTIAVEAAKRLQGFGANILGINTNGRNVEYFDKCFSMDNIDKVLSESHVVVLTIPYTKNTHHLINEDKFSCMKDKTFFINISRGAIVDETALIRNLQSGKIAGAALDVFNEEPLQKSSPLWDMDNVIVTPHNSWVSEVSTERRLSLIYDNMKRYVQKENLLNVTDITKGY